MVLLSFLTAVFAGRARILQCEYIFEKFVVNFILFYLCLNFRILLSFSALPLSKNNDFRYPLCGIKASVNGGVFVSDSSVCWACKDT
jgi:hypothetical protein